MKKMIKKGFSMIELLFVMVILASLAAIAIPSMSSGTESAILTSMKSDAMNLITAVNSDIPRTENFQGYEGYQAILGSEWSGVPDQNGFVYVLDSGKPVSITQGNYLDSLNPEGNTSLCSGPLSGFSFEIKNDKLPTKSVSYNSCTGSTIVVNDITASN